MRGIGVIVLSGLFQPALRDILCFSVLRSTIAYCANPNGANNRAKLTSDYVSS
jgi:hypothetical protein